MTEAKYTVFNALVDIFASPGRALDEVKKHTGWLIWPLLIAIGVNVGTSVFYLNWVDFDWFVNEQIRALPPEMTSEQVQGVREFLTPGKASIFEVVRIILMTLVILLLQSVYLHLANTLMTGAEVRFGQWFAFSSWTTFVGIVNPLAALVVVLIADSNQLGQADLMPLSINSLLIHAEPGEPWFTWGTFLTLVSFWVFALMTIGYHRWTNASMVKSGVIACLPWALIFGIWALRI